MRSTWTFAGKPAAVSWGTNRIDVVMAATDGHLWWANTGNGGSNWSTLVQIGGGTAASGASPAIGSRGSGILDVYFRGGDNTLWQVSYQNSAWGSVAPTKKEPRSGLLSKDTG